jgi:hypothetical protein
LGYNEPLISHRNRDMQSFLSDSAFVLKRHGGATAGRYRLYSMQQTEPLLFIEEKSGGMSPLSTAHFYEDEQEQREVLTLTDVEQSGIEQEVVDAETGEKIGTIGLEVDDAGDFVGDTWVIRDAAGDAVGRVLRKRGNNPVPKGVLRAEPPQEMELTFGSAVVGQLRERTNVVGYELAIDFRMDAARLLDRRLGLAVAVFAACDKTKSE